MASQDKIGKYTMVRHIATGGMAEIWLAEQEGPGGFSKQLVIKRILPHLARDERVLARHARREGELFRQVRRRELERTQHLYGQEPRDRQAGRGLAPEPTLLCGIRRAGPLLPSAKGSPKPSDAVRGARGGQRWPHQDGQYDFDYAEEPN